MSRVTPYHMPFAALAEMAGDFDSRLVAVCRPEVWTLPPGHQSDETIGGWL
jgi:hypothetical protein